ncbi:arginine-tRNA ligase, variant 1 [Aphanomyces invadans]|uniref:arginine--tRNA ligase n=1 Tax=Aphanomyces invadans TaxID=157072 RepID=A0A024TP75_9STRA|nr:arginine-tRNA ligase, variant 1 [Aphanomyces invadans]ETV95925.1 arginine-tRNA ligase, variant 1 [Aphanomyces invadans]|eukprot:XP_008875236.1 arginine-tRNA ligase, variant 1 [Aphanomyces invadans]
MWRGVHRRAVSTFSIQARLQAGLLGGHADFTEKTTFFRRSHQPNVDYQTSAVMSLGLPKNTVLSTAQSVAQTYGEQHEWIASASAAKPGFINVKLKDDWIAEHTVHVATRGVQPRRQDRPENVLVDFASPNMGKELHVGHLRSSVLGDTISNLLEFQGHAVSRISHVGDLGAAIATLIVQALDIQDNATHGLPRTFDETTTVSTLGQWYERGKHRLGSSDVAFKAAVDETVLGLQRQDPKWQHPWELTCSISRAAHQSLYQRLRVKVHERGEATYISMIPTVLSKLRAIASESQGALCIFVDGPDKSPMLVRKQDGGFLYATTDLAALYSRVFGQSLHFRHLFEAAKLAGWLADRPVKLEHAGFGLVMGEDGTKLSSRKGGATTLGELLDQAALESQARSVVPNADHRAIGDAAVRYYELAQHRERNYKFSFANVLNLKGNTAPYLMYAMARLQGILRKADLPHAASWADYLAQHADATTELQHASSTWHPNERALALVLGQFEDALIDTQTHWHPHLLADYLFRVVTAFHSFYETCLVQANPSRLILCAATDAVLRRGLHLLGIPSVDRM